MTAAWLHGLAVGDWRPIDVIIDVGAGISGRAGIRVRRAVLPAQDVTSSCGFKVTTIERTLADLCVDRELAEVIVLSDEATHRRLTTIRNLRTYAQRSARRGGIAKFRELIELTEPKTESPMESRLRMLLVTAKLPKPLVQVPIYDCNGEFLGRPDLYYPEQRLAIEYDGSVHKTSLAEDNRRQNRMLAEGIRFLRFTASDVYHRPGVVLDQVRAMLHRAV